MSTEALLDAHSKDEVDALQRIQPTGQPAVYECGVGRCDVSSPTGRGIQLHRVAAHREEPDA